MSARERDINTDRLIMCAQRESAEKRLRLYVRIIDRLTSYSRYRTTLFREFVSYASCAKKEIRRDVVLWCQIATEKSATKALKSGTRYYEYSGWPKSQKCSRARRRGFFRERYSSSVCVSMLSIIHTNNSCARVQLLPKKSSQPTRSFPIILKHERHYNQLVKSNASFSRLSANWPRFWYRKDTLIFEDNRAYT